MKKVFAAIVMFFVVVALAGASYAWQGRMEGMGNPQGLINDESDFLLHPAQITFGEGVKYYLDYKFTYTGLIHMDSDIKGGLIGIGSIPILGGNLTSGHTTEHNTLVGASFPFAKGRMGIFLGYDKQNGDMDSDIKLFGYTTPVDSNADTRLDNYALRLIYGRPVGGMNLGAELGVAYRNEKQDDTLSLMDYPAIYSLEGIGATLPYMIPFNSSYWELSGKLGANKKINKTDIDLSAYGAWILGADTDNKYNLQANYDVFGSGQGYRMAMDGDVRGYRVGSDLWVRHHVNDSISLPFLVSFEYAKKDRDSDGFLRPYAYGAAPLPDFIDGIAAANTKYVSRTINVKAGGGIEHAREGCGRVGTGLYYHYIQSRDRLDLFGAYAEIEEGIYFVDANINKFPYHKEHRLELNVAGEQIVCEDLTVRGGMNFFYGWVRSDDYGGSAYGYFDGDSGSGSATLPLDGHTWGISGSLGATQKLCGLTFEPFIRGGYQFFDTDGSTRVYGPYTVGLDKKKTEWFTACGLSVLFGK